MTDKKAHLTIDGIDKTIELPIYASTIGPDVIDVTSITKNGFFTSASYRARFTSNQLFWLFNASSMKNS